MELIITGIAFILFGVSWWWDDKVNAMRHHELGEFAFDVFNDLRDLKGQLHDLLHDTQQIKHRLTTIKRTTKKDLEYEYGTGADVKKLLSSKTVVVHTKHKRFKGK